MKAPDMQGRPKGALTSLPDVFRFLNQNSQPNSHRSFMFYILHPS